MWGMDWTDLAQDRDITKKKINQLLLFRGVYMVLVGKVRERNHLGDSGV
jgi:hypothetical protein